MKYFVQPAEAWVNNVLKKQGDEVTMTEDEARYLVLAGVLGKDKPGKPKVAAKPAPSPVAPKEAAKESAK